MFFIIYAMDNPSGSAPATIASTMSCGVFFENDDHFYTSLFLVRCTKKEPRREFISAGLGKSVLCLSELFQNSNSNSVPLPKVKRKAAEKVIKAVVVNKIHCLYFL